MIDESNDIYDYLRKIVVILNENIVYLFKSLSNINEILVENKKKENELEWRLHRLESILIIKEE
jgi:hypothetical protein